jgi:PP-loop superfamily ATP-utilizing enzyme
MERPISRVVHQQQVDTTIKDVTGSSEAEELLRKYGHTQQFTTRKEPEQAIEQPGLTFEQMVAQQESKRKSEDMKKQQQNTGPKPITFNGGNGYDTEVKYGSDESGLGYTIQISTDMKIPKNY